MASPTQSTGLEHGTHPSNSTLHQSIPVEMSDLDTAEREGAGSQGLPKDVSIPSTSPLKSDLPTTTASTSGMATENARSAETSNNAISITEPAKGLLSSSNNASAASASASATTGPSSSDPPAITRLDSVAIGPSIDNMPTSIVTSEAGPVLVITLLLTSGARHPYKIDEKYLTKRNVTVPGVTENGKKDPLSISVYTLKELILREWREEWEAQPSSPSSIRLIYFGRLLDDKTPLKGKLSRSILSHF